MSKNEQLSEEVRTGEIGRENRGVRKREQVIEEEKQVSDEERTGKLIRENR